MIELISKPHLTRQWDLIPERALKTPVTVIGAGAIGSWVVFQLAKMGFEDITVWDPDEVSVENMSCQLYGRSHIGEPKVKALANIVNEFTEIAIDRFYLKWESGFRTQGIVVLAVDSMQARKDIWNEIVDTQYDVTHVIDARMGAEHAAMYVMEPTLAKDRESYVKTLYTDENAVQEACTAKSTAYTANLLSGLVVKAIKDIVTAANNPRSVQYAIGPNSMITWRKDGTRA